ncbi:MAG: hypothetical protein EAX86_01235 [Candidatus Heimdallarchaeota archaeon]|nr:hypothetical protein [Candidatus Heimdallarchaeota archaeon]
MQKVYSGNCKRTRVPKILTSELKRTPFQTIKRTIRTQQVIPKDLWAFLPRGWKRIGTVGILELNSNLHPWKHQIGEVYLKSIPEIDTIIHKVGVTRKTIREPSYEYLAGNPNTITLHKELGCKFWIDALKITFSNGNHAERLRMIKEIRPCETILDMFACVGNLSIPIAVNHSSVKVIGIEINPYAFQFLKKNVQMNGIEEQYQPIKGDNRIVSPKNWASRVLMGYFGIQRDQLCVALASLRSDKGGILHVHGLAGNQEKTDFRDEINQIIVNSFPNFQVTQVKKITIKTVAAGVHHYVDDITISPIK